MLKQRIPVIMYHSIGIVNKNWHWNYLTCPYEIFEDQLKWLKKTGYHTLNFQEVYDYIMKDIPVPNNSVFLTFDDGYLDNYVFAYPLLKKYGMKGTIFVNPDFVDKRNIVRSNLNDINLIKDITKLENIGFCSWDELRKVDKEGVLDVQSHAKTHTWYPISDEIIDYRHPGDDYIWMDWNKNPLLKPNLQCINWDEVELGEAVFKHEKALSSKRVFINDKFQNRLKDFVKKNGGRAFFDESDWKEKLQNYTKRLKKDLAIISKVETEKEYLYRLRDELEYTKTEIEKQLNKKVYFLCWPGGSATKEGIKISEELGYLMSTAAKDLSNSYRKKLINSPEKKINRITRFTPVMYNNWSDKDKGMIKYAPGWFFILQLMRFQDKYYAGFWVKAIQFFIIRIAKKFG